MGELRIECFHRVVPDAQREAQWPYFARGTAMTVSEFDGYLAWLANHYEMVDERAAIERLETRSPSSPACWITFDDGYRDCLEHVAPVVEKYGVRPSLFMTTRALGGDWWPPVDRWYSILRSAGERAIALEFAGLSERWDLATNPGRQQAVSGPLKTAYVAAEPAKQEKLLALLAGASAASHEPSSFLSAAELEDLSARGWFVGPHGHEHLLLAQVGIARLVEDLRKSAELLDTLSLQSRSRWIAYADGQYNDSLPGTVLSAFASGGYCGALTIDRRIAARGEDRWALPRFVASPSLAPVPGSVDPDDGTPPEAR